jgi:dihydropteroate synthase
MRRYYTRVCNFYYGNESRLLVNSNKSIPLNGNKNISFDHIEIISRTSKRKISINKINSLTESIKKIIKIDLKQITTKKKNFSNLNFIQIPNIMGVLNITPDSFSDGGEFNKGNKGLRHALEMFNSGANIIDIGGESTRPGSKAIDNKTEWKRIERLIKLIGNKIPISLDTRKSEVMRKGITYGVRIINDVSGLDYDTETINVLKKYKTPFILQHSQGTPENMQKKPRYNNELLDIYDFFENKIKFLKKIGIKHNNIIIDPGIGFGKNLKHNINLIRNISIFHSLGFPILVGNSKKRFIKEIAQKNDTKNRIGGTVASSIYLMLQGVQILRIHDVNELLQGIKVFKQIIKN